MGTVHAKELHRQHEHRPEALNLKEIPARVKRVHVDGLLRTKDDLAAQEVKDVLYAENFKDMVKRANLAKSRLERLGIFASIGIFIDTDKETKDGYDVTFEVTELKNIIGGVNTLVGTNDASLVSDSPCVDVFRKSIVYSIIQKSGHVKHNLTPLRRQAVRFLRTNVIKPVYKGGAIIMQNRNDYISSRLSDNLTIPMFNLRSPNVFGRAEKFSAEYSHGTKHNSGFSVDFIKPFEKNPDTKIQVRAFQHAGDFPWSSYRQTDRGLAAHLAFQSPLGEHGLRWEGVWRELEALSNTTAFAVREQMGHTLISSVKHTLVRDRRDNPVMPEMGTLIRLSQEYAGLGGDAEFVKHDAEFQISQRLFFSTVIQFSLAGGIMNALNPERPIRICDKFFLGGPLTLRGFQMRGAGEHSDGDAVGATSYWTAGAHLYTPLPFRPGRGGFGDLFRTHLFVNAGGLGAFNLNDSAHQNLLSAYYSMRLAYGGGLVFRFGRVARMELNYCVPVRAEAGDKVTSGLQFGIGVAFL